MTEKKSSNVFAPGGFPEVTYVHRELFDKTEMSVEPHCLNLVCGNSKLGKTVFVKNLYPSNEAVWIFCGAISTEEAFWENVIYQMNLYTMQQISIDDTKGVNASAKVSAKLPGVENFGGEFSAGANAGKTNTVLYGRETSSKTVALSKLEKFNVPLILEDFQYLDQEAASSILMSFKKYLENDGTLIIITNNPDAFVKLIEVEMLPQIRKLEITPWSDDELCEIAKKGFKGKDVIDINHITKSCEAAFGNPYLMQEFCSELHKKGAVEENRAIPATVRVEEILSRIAEAQGTRLVNILTERAGERKSRKLQDGTSVDIYGIILKALKEINPGREPFAYDKLEEKIQQIVRGGVPQKNEITNCLGRMQNWTTKKSKISYLIWNKDKEQITIENPYLLLWLKWAK